MATTKSDIDAVIKNVSKSMKIDENKFRSFVQSDEHIDCLPTTIPELDAMLGIGGLPWGTIVEIYGPEQSGKTWLAYILSASCQNQEPKLPVLYLDIEGTLNPARARAVGVDTLDKESFRWMNEFDSGNQALDIVDHIVETGAFGLVVIDSVAALLPKEEVDVDTSQSVGLGLHARMMSRAVRKIANSVKNKKTIVVFINQTRSGNLGSFMGATEETPGGKALKFYSHVRIRLQARKAKDSRILDKDKKVIGNMTQCRLIKTRYGMPFEECDFPIYFVERTRDPFLEFFTFAERKGIMKYASRYYRYPIEEPIVKEKEIDDFKRALIDGDHIYQIAKDLGFDDVEQVISNIIESSPSEEDSWDDINALEEE